MAAMTAPVVKPFSKPAVLVPAVLAAATLDATAAPTRWRIAVSQANSSRGPEVQADEVRAEMTNSAR
ncbi:hypothetical protein OG994_12325 [Micromonospora globbae]|uniref:Uncharacterized protein n=1 Tax=Micromonospora globbae TaxID=1894969 RepID=A0ABZ1SE63_9ACTN|nr:hypothetical protein [Micromonospora globbae]